MSSDSIGYMLCSCFRHYTSRYFTLYTTSANMSTVQAPVLQRKKGCLREYRGGSVMDVGGVLFFIGLEIQVPEHRDKNLKYVYFSISCMIKHGPKKSSFIVVPLHRYKKYLLIKVKQQQRRIIGNILICCVINR